MDFKECWCWRLLFHNDGLRTITRRILGMKNGYAKRGRDS
jgi:hypothetical protein